MAEKEFTVAQAIEVQDEQLEGWRSVLKAKVFADLDSSDWMAYLDDDREFVEATLDIEELNECIGKE